LKITGHFTRSSRLDIRFRNFTQLAHLSVAASMILENRPNLWGFADFDTARTLPRHLQTLSLKIKDEVTKIGGIMPWLLALYSQKPCEPLRHIQLRSASSLPSSRARLAIYNGEAPALAFAPRLGSSRTVAVMSHYCSCYNAIILYFQNAGVTVELLFRHAHLYHEFVRIP
jgi:hypothetical protein